MEVQNSMEVEFEIDSCYKKKHWGGGFEGNLRFT
jgi:hypothetical protein